MEIKLSSFIPSALGYNFATFIVSWGDVDISTIIRKNGEVLQTDLRKNSPDYLAVLKFIKSTEEYKKFIGLNQNTLINVPASFKEKVTITKEEAEAAVNKIAHLEQLIGAIKHVVEEHKHDMALSEIISNHIESYGY